MAVTSKNFTGDDAIKIHGSGVPNAYCGNYPDIRLSFTIIFDRTGNNNNQQIVWHTEGMGNWIHPTSGTYGYHLYAYIEMNDTGKHAVLTKDDTTGSNWWNHTTLSDTGEQSFDTTSNQAVMKVWVKSKDSCQHNGHFCYRGDGGYTLLYAITVDLPTYETFYTVSYNANGGTDAPSSQTKSNLSDLTLSSKKPTYGLTVNYQSSPSYADTIYRQFVNWSASTGGTYGPGGTYSVNSDCTMTANWGSASFTARALPSAYYTVTYNNNGGEGGRASDSLARIADSWNTNSSGTGDRYLAGYNYSTTANIILYPIYKNPTLKYSSLPAPTRSGYVFGGWYLNGTKVTGNLVITGNTTLVANWVPVPLHIFKSNGRWDAPETLKVWRFNGTSWVQDRDVFQFGSDGTWHNISH